MLRVGLFVEGTFFPSYEGATRRFTALATHLARSGAHVVVFHCFRGWSDECIISSQPFYTYFIPPEQFYGNINLFVDIIKSEQLDVLSMSDFETVLKLGVKLKGLLPEIRICFEVHDIASDFKRSLGIEAEVVAQTASAEAAAFSIADLCICFSQRDAERVRQLLHIEYHLEGRIVPARFGIEVPNVKFVGPNPAALTVTFLGNLFHAPNTRAVSLIAEHVAPVLFARNPDISICIVGDAPDNLIQRYSKDRMFFTGKVDDLRPVFQRTSLGLAPIFHGSGVKVKVLEYSAFGIPTLCTSQSVTGIIWEPEELSAFYIEDNLLNYAERIVALLSNPSELQRLGNAAFKVVERHSWANVEQEAFKLYQLCASSKVKPCVITPKNEWLTLTPYYLVNNVEQRFSTRTPKFRGIMRGGWGMLETIN